ncbi:MAG: putative ferredoxin--NADP(+) reductase [Nocardia sp.]|uniref:FAD-dependent oxidoreductase n=1 Tax=Nocardia sp. TaxID=1821 RepID=UPI00261F8EF5|nr:FAD-dependent oxidoreductase [Nocardia sp.]MCU1646117.1 putative ferredoxin--NADP(+) reductase [Nocardia sp.]
MTHIILGHCCKDASCVKVCPQDCIHPAPREPGFESAERLYIDPRTCIDCTACVEACPASAIKSEHELTIAENRYTLQAQEFFSTTSVVSGPAARRVTFEQSLGTPGGRLKVAVVGSGPAAMYTVRELLRRSGSVRVTVFEQHGEIGGLLHRGVSPDHSEIRDMIRLFEVPFNDDRVEVILNTEVGVDISVSALRSRFDAVVLAYGASQPRKIGSIDEAGRGGVYEAIDILTAANSGSSDSPPHGPLGPECVVVGAGNVALDIVRYVARMNIDSAAGGAVRELVVLSRSAPDRASFTPSSFYELLDLDSVDLLIDAAGIVPESSSKSALLQDISTLPSADVSGAEYGWWHQGYQKLRVILSFGNDVTSIEGTSSSEVAVVTASGRRFVASSAICAAGFTTKNIAGLPAGESGTVLNRRGKVISRETGGPLERLYVVGWAKRGATGGVGDNRVCARETVAQLAADVGLENGDTR